MTERIKILIFVGLIVAFGLSARLFTFQSAHPDSDEMFELQHLQKNKPADILKQNTFYGDHTSFPGEYLIEYPSLLALNLFEKPAIIDIANKKIEGLNKTSFWVLAIPKIALFLFSIFLFYRVCEGVFQTSLGWIVAFSILLFNNHAIYHAFSLRPYGILTELAIINLWFCGSFNSERWFRITHGIVIFVTCIYHAYGPLIALLPLLGYWHMKKFSSNEVIAGCVLGLSGWIWYAAYNTFGMHPNGVQSIVDTFQFITKADFLNKILESFFGGVIVLSCLPFVLWGITKITGLQLRWFLVMILLPLTLIILVDIKTQYWIHPRQYIWLLPALALWCGALAERAARND